MRRFLNGEPISARPATRWERGLRWAKRRPAAAALLVVSGLAVMAFVGAMVALSYSVHLERAYRETMTAHEQAEAALDDAIEAKKQEDIYKYFHHIALAHADWRNGNVGRVKQFLSDCPEDLRRWEWGFLDRLCHLDLFTFDGHSGLVQCAAYGPDGAEVASASWDGTVKVWNAETGHVRLTLGGHDNAVWALAFNPDGSRLASSGADRSVKLWNLDQGAEILTLRGHGRGIGGIAFDPSGDRLASASQDGSIKIWDADRRLRNQDARRPLRRREWRGVPSRGYESRFGQQRPYPDRLGRGNR